MLRFLSRNIAIAVLFLLVVVPSAAPAKGDKNRSPIAGKATPESRAADQLALAYQVAGWARENGDGSAMIVAARMANAVAKKDLPQQGQAAPGKDALPPDLFVEARQLALGDADLLEEISRAQSAQGKGCICGAIAVTRWVPGNTDWTVNVTARGGETFIAAARVGKLAVGMQLIDENNNVVCEDTSGDDVIGCRITRLGADPSQSTSSTSALTAVTSHS